MRYPSRSPEAYLLREQRAKSYADINQMQMLDFIIFVVIVIDKENANTYREGGYLEAFRSLK